MQFSNIEKGFEVSNTGAWILSRISIKMSLGSRFNLEIKALALACEWREFEGCTVTEFLSTGWGVAVTWDGLEQENQMEMKRWQPQ